MSFLPIVERELREASRRRRTYGSRVIAAGLGLLVGGWLMLIPSFSSDKTFGLALFISLTVILLIDSIFAGVLRTADCLSEEKRDGTLGLLFLTDLKGHDVVLGKLAARALTHFYGSLALVPILAVPLLAGGVTAGEFWRVVLVALNTQFFSLTVGLFCSSISRDERRSMMSALALILFFVALLPLASAIAWNWPETRELAQYLKIPSPGYATVMAFDEPAKAAKANYFYHSLAFTHVLSWICLAMASRVVRQSWQETGLDVTSGRRRQWWHRLRLGDAIWRLRDRRRWLPVNPYYWLLGRYRLRSMGLWTVLLAGMAIWVFGLSFYSSDWLDEGAYVTTSILAHAALKFFLVMEAPRHLSRDRQSGALELVLSTPLPVRDIVRGQIMALERQFAGPLAVVLLADLVFIAAMRRQTDMLILGVCWIVLLGADLLTLAWLGMWHGLKSKRSNRAAIVTAMQVLFLPWLIFFLLVTLLAFFSSEIGLGRWANGMEEGTAMIGTLVFFLLFDLFFFLSARRGLLQRFRDVAAGSLEQRRARAAETAAV